MPSFQTGTRSPSPITPMSRQQDALKLMELLQQELVTLGNPQSFECIQMKQELKQKEWINMRVQPTMLPVVHRTVIC